MHFFCIFTVESCYDVNMLYLRSIFCTDLSLISEDKGTDIITFRKTGGIKRIDYEKEIKQNDVAGNWGCPAADRM